MKLTKLTFAVLAMAATALSGCIMISTTKADKPPVAQHQAPSQGPVA